MNELKKIKHPYIVLTLLVVISAILASVCSWNIGEIFKTSTLWLEYQQNTVLWEMQLTGQVLAIAISIFLFGGAVLSTFWQELVKNKRVFTYLVFSIFISIFLLCSTTSWQILTLYCMATLVFDYFFFYIHSKRFALSRSLDFLLYLAMVSLWYQGMNSAFSFVLACYTILRFFLHDLYFSVESSKHESANIELVKFSSAFMLILVFLLKNKVYVDYQLFFSVACSLYLMVHFFRSLMSGGLQRSHSYTMVIALGVMLMINHAPESLLVPYSFVLIFWLMFLLKLPVLIDQIRSSKLYLVTTVLFLGSVTFIPFLPFFSITNYFLAQFWNDMSYLQFFSFWGFVMMPVWIAINSFKLKNKSDLLCTKTEASLLITSVLGFTLLGYFYFPYQVATIDSFLWFYPDGGSLYSNSYQNSTVALAHFVIYILMSGLLWIFCESLKEYGEKTIPLRDKMKKQLIYLSDIPMSYHKRMESYISSTYDAYRNGIKAVQVKLSVIEKIKIEKRVQNYVGGTLVFLILSIAIYRILL